MVVVGGRPRCGRRSGWSGGVEDGLPSLIWPVGLARLVALLDGHEVEHLQRRLLGREVPTVAHGLAEPGVQRLDGIGGLHDLAELDGEGEERHEVVPGPFPGGGPSPGSGPASARRTRRTALFTACVRERRRARSLVGARERRASDAPGLTGVVPAGGRRVCSAPRRLPGTADDRLGSAPHRSGWPLAARRIRLPSLAGAVVAPELVEVVHRQARRGRSRRRRRAACWPGRR